MKNRVVLYIAFILCGAAAVFQCPAAFAYEGVSVKNGGTITGRVTLEGEIPTPRLFHLVLYPFGPFCEKRDSDGKGNRVLIFLDNRPEKIYFVYISYVNK